MCKEYDIDHELGRAIEDALEALQNVPEVGSIYDQQHSDMHMKAYLRLKRARRNTDVFGEDDEG